MEQTVITNSFKQTQKLGKDFAKKLTGGEVIALHGDLGGGKTTFVQGLAQGLGVEKNIISPTFIIMRTYDISIKYKVSCIKYFYHVDLYRIGQEREVVDLGLLELMGDVETIVAIEWPEKIENLLPEKRIDVFFEYLDEEKRKISINI